ncbi:MAG: hypothetical protein EBV86_18055 [Marivivens sp.]|nr:hypothetical protein [Marivivens sp.]
MEELASTKLEESASVQLSAFTTTKAFTTYSKHFELYHEYENTKTSNDPVLSETDFWESHIHEFGELEPEFVLYWRKKMINAHPRVIEELQSRINIEDTVLQKISDCLGAAVFEADGVIDARYTPVYDIDLESNTPQPYGSVLESKLDLKLKNVVVQATSRATSLYHQNLSDLSQQADPRQAHADNLVTDIYHINRIAVNKGDLLESVAAKLGDVYETFVFVSSYKLNNIQRVVDVTFKRDIEGRIRDVDIRGVVEDSERQTSASLLS